MLLIYMRDIIGFKMSKFCMERYSPFCLIFNSNLDIINTGAVHGGSYWFYCFLTRYNFCKAPGISILEGSFPIFFG